MGTGPHVACSANRAPCLLLHTSNLRKAIRAECEYIDNARVLRVNARHRGLPYLDDVIHEWLHALNPAWGQYDREDEAWVTWGANELAPLVQRTRTKEETRKVIRRWLCKRCRPEYGKCASELTNLVWHPEVMRRAGFTT